MADQLSNDLASLKIQRDAEPEGGGPLRTILVTAVVVVALGGAYFLGRPYVEAKVFKAEVAATEIALVSPAQASIELTATGYVVPQRTSKVGAKVTGRIMKLPVAEGDRVKAGSLIALLDDVDQRSGIAAATARVFAAEARTQAARANLAETKLQADRQRGLAERGAAPKAAADDLDARARALEESVRAAEAEVRSAQAEVKTLEITLQNMQILAPISATVIAKPAQIGEMVGPSTGPIVELADFDSLLVEADVPESRLHRVKLGGPTEVVLDAFPSRRHRGEVADIVPRVNRAKASVTVKVRLIDAAEGVLPDMSARVSFLEKALDEATLKEPPKLIIPGSAITERGGGKVIFVLEGDRVRMIPVTLGPPFGSGFELTKGPGAGTRVVKDPPAQLTDGERIKEKNP